MMFFTLIFVIIYLFGGIKSVTILYFICGCMGFCDGFWAMFVTIGAEQFGTNLRATAATTIPNMVRGAVIPMTLLYKYFKPDVGVIEAGAIVGAICFAISFYSILTIPETHGKDLDFLEE
jgi:hypothetical protein